MAKVNAAGGKAFADFMVAKETKRSYEPLESKIRITSLFFPDAGKKEE
jgi:hypothetical protein